jgi:hypothetical protein
MHPLGLNSGELSYSHSVVGILAAAFIFAPLAMLFISYAIAGLLVYFAFTKAERFVRWIGPSDATPRPIPGAAARSTA